MKTNKDEQIRKQKAFGRKSAYHAPKLEVYGSAADLTKGVGGSHVDPGHGNNAKHGTG